MWYFAGTGLQIWAFTKFIAGVFPLFYTVFFTAVLLAYSKLKPKAAPWIDAYVLVGLVVALNLLYASA